MCTTLFTIASLTLVPQLATGPGAVATGPAAFSNRAAGPERTTHVWHDLDADGLRDLYVLTLGQEDVALKQLPDGSFVEATDLLGLAGNHSIQVLPHPTRTTDLLLVGVDGGARLLQCDETGVFFEEQPGLGLEGVRSAVWLDYDGDGREDLWALGHGGGLQLWRQGEDARFTRVELELADGGTSTVGLPGTHSASLASTGNPTVGPGLPELGASGPMLRTAHSLVDQISGSTLEASSYPTLGMLYPLSSDFFINHVGVGIGTTDPQADLHVDGEGRMHELRLDTTTGPPLEVFSSSHVENLNADFLDGLDSSAFSQLGNSIEGLEISLHTIDASRIVGNSLGQGELAPNSVGVSELSANSVQSVDIIDGSIINADVSPNAGIDGTKIDADFGTQTVVSGGAVFTDSSMFHGESLTATNGNGGDFRGHLGVFGANNFEGVNSADWEGFELGVVGMSTDSGDIDNFGVMGHSNGVGVRGENASNPSSDFGELGGKGVGLRAKGSIFAGSFSGVVAVVSDDDFDGSLGSGSLFVRNTANTRGLHIDDNEIGTDGGPLQLNLNNLENTRINNFVHVKTDNRVGIGTSVPSEVLHVIGNVRCTSVIQTSDARYKQDVRDLESAMAILRKLRGVSYLWDRDQLPEAGVGRQLGFLAQELRQVVPEAVVEAEDGTLGVSYSALVPLLVEALQEQEQRFEERLSAIEGALVLLGQD